MEYTQNFYRNYNIKNSSMVNKIWVKEKRAVTVLEVRSCEFLLRTITALFFSSTFITLLLFLCGEERTSSDLLPSVTHCSLPRAYNYCRMQEESHSLRRRNSSDLPPPPRIAPCREFTITVEYKKAMMMCVAGIRQTLPLRHALLPAESVQVL